MTPQSTVLNPESNCSGSIHECQYWRWFWDSGPKWGIRKIFHVPQPASTNEINWMVLGWIRATVQSSPIAKGIAIDCLVLKVGCCSEQCNRDDYTLSPGSRASAEQPLLMTKKGSLHCYFPSPTSLMIHLILVLAGVTPNILTQKIQPGKKETFFLWKINISKQF